MDVITLLLATGLTARIVRFLTIDAAGVPVFGAILAVGKKVGRKRGEAFVEDLFDCPFCIGLWVSIGVAASWAVYGHTVVWQAVALAGAASWFAGHLVLRYDREMW